MLRSFANRSFVRALLLIGLLPASAVATQGNFPMRSFTESLLELVARDQLESWLQQNVPGATTYAGPGPTDDGQPTTGRRLIDFDWTTFRRYTWSDCGLRVEEARLSGTWLVPERLETTAVVSMKDTGAVGGAVSLQDEGTVTISLSEGTASTGNAGNGRMVRIFARNPQVVSTVLMRYAAECKLRK